jgi:hypothetical protein
MYLNSGQIWALKKVLDLFYRIGLEQKDLVQQVGGEVKAVDFSRAKKNGYVPPGKWDVIPRKLLEIAGKDSNPEHKAQVNEICLLIENRLLAEAPFAAVDDSDYAGSPDLQRAARARGYNQDLNPAIWNIAPPTSIYTVQIPYPEEPTKADPALFRSLMGDQWEDRFGAIKRLKQGMESFQTKMRMAIVEANASSPGCRIRTLPATAGFRGLLSAARIQTTALIYLIPFYLTADRRLEYGVVRYGSHRLLCLLVSRATLRSALGHERDTIERDDFVKLIDAGLKIYHVEPYSAEHILCQMLLETQDEGVLARFNEANMPPENNFRTAVGSLAADPASTMLVFEVADQFVIAERLLEHASAFGDHKMVQLRHGVETDVGFGYSLRAFEWIVRDLRFKALRKTAMDLIEPFREDVRYMGIEIDPKENGKRKPKK